MGDNAVPPKQQESFSGAAPTHHSERPQHSGVRAGSGLQLHDLAVQQVDGIQPWFGGIRSCESTPCERTELRRESTIVEYKIEDAGGIASTAVEFR